MGDSLDDLVAENERLRLQTAELNKTTQKDKEEMDRLRSQCMRLQKQMDGSSPEPTEIPSDSATRATMKVMRVVEQFVKNKDLNTVVLSSAALNDMAFHTLAQVLTQCPSLDTVDVSRNLLTMDSCSDLCQILTTSPKISHLSLNGNAIPLRAIGYFMTACMERATKRMRPVTIIDVSANVEIALGLQSNGGRAPFRFELAWGQDTGKTSLDIDDPEIGQFASLAKQVRGRQISDQAAALCIALSRTLWQFLHDTIHPQVRGLNPSSPQWNVLEIPTIEKMELALSRIVVIEEETAAGRKTVTADWAVIRQPGAHEAERKAPAAQSEMMPAQMPSLPPRGQSPIMDSDMRRDHDNGSQAQEQQQPRPDSGMRMSGALGGAGKQMIAPAASTVQDMNVGGRQSPSATMPQFNSGTDYMGSSTQQFRDEFQSLREPAKNMTFNLKQVIMKNGSILMNILERLLETTDIEATDVESGQTLLEYACNTGNIGLAKLCYRRGAKLAKLTKDGETPFNIAVKRRSYELMEFLHLYGVPVNSADAKGETALHVATRNNDVDALCRLIEWGADVNLRDNKRKTPLMCAAEKGHKEVAMLLLELGADLNAQDEKEFTAVAHAEANDHFQLMDRFVKLGGHGHRLMAKDILHGKGPSKVGDVKAAKFMRKSTSLSRLAKHSVSVALT